MKTIFTAALFMLVIGCAHYDPLSIEQLSQKNQHVSELTSEVCADLYAGARALSEGPERAYAWFGRAREIDDANVIMRKQGVVCYSAEARDLSLNGQERILDAFKETWKSAEEVVQ